MAQYISNYRKLYTILSFVSIIVVLVLAPVIYLSIMHPADTVLADSTFFLDEGYGSTVNDANKSVTGGAITGAVWKNEELCKVGKCLYFDGSGDKVTFTDDADLDFIAADDFTITGWFRHPEISTDPDYLIAKHESGTAGGYKIYMDSDGDLVFAIDDDGTWDTTNIIGGSLSKNYDDNVWHHFAAQKDGTTGIYLYVDGYLIAQDTDLTGDTGTLANAASFYIGIDADGSSNSWSGFIDQVKVTRLLLTADQIKADYLAITEDRGTSASFDPDQSYLSDGLVGYWRMDEASTPMIDSSGNGNNGAWTASITCYNDGSKYGNCYYCGGDGHLMTVTNSSSLNFSDGNMSFSFWMNPDIDSNLTVFQKGNGDNSDEEYKVNISRTASGMLSLFYKGSWRDSTTTPVQFDTWQYITVVVENGTKIKFYHNGQISGSPIDVASGTYGPTLTNNVIFSPTSSQFVGKLDEFRMYNRALSPSEIQKLYSWAPGPIGEWKLDENTGTSAQDLSGNGSTMTLTSPQWSAGKFGSGLSFKSTMIRYGTIADNTTLSLTGNVTLSVWIRPASVSANAWYPIAGKWDGSNESYLLMQVGDEIRMYIDALANYQTTTAANLLPETWYYVSAVYTAASQTVTIYVNGVVQASSATGTIPTSIGDDGGSFMVSYLAGSISNKYVNSSTDDAYDQYGGGAYDDSSADIYMGGNEGVGVYIAGTRFTNMTIPPGARIGSASFDVMNNYNGTYSLEDSRVYGENADNPAAFSSGSSPVVRSKTTAYADWGCSSSGSISDGVWFSASTYCKPPSITNIVQEIVNRTGWTYNNAMAFIYDLHPDGDAGHWFDGRSYDYGTPADNAPRLNVSWTSSYDGVIDDLKLYNYTRTPAQIIEDMNAGHPAPGSPVGSAVAHWKFDEGYGTTAYDNSINANHLTLSGTSWTNSGKFGNALNGNGGSFYAMRASDPDLEFASGESFSVSQWVKSDVSINSLTTEYIVVNGGPTGSGGAGYAVFFNASGLICFGIDDDSTWNPDVMSCSSNDMYDGSWHMVTAVRDVILDTINLYVDGIFIDSDPDTTTGTLDSNSVFYIADDGNDIAPFSGDIDEVKVYRLAMTPDQVKTEYNQGSMAVMGALSTDSSGNPSWSATDSYCPPGQGSACTAPVGEWKMDENSGTSYTYDTSANGYTGTLTNTTPSSWVPGYAGSALLLDGSAGYVDVGAGPSSVKSISFWVHPKTTTEYFLNLTSNTDYIWLDGGTLTATGIDTPTYYVDGIRYTSAPTVTANQWHHIAITSATAENASNIDIGRTQDTNYLEGTIDQVRLYSNELTPAQIAWDYNRGGPVGWWKMDETSWNGTASEVKDSSGNNYHGTASCSSCTVPTTGTGKLNNGGVWDANGISQEVQVAENDLLDIGLGSMTWAVWYKTSSENAVGLFRKSDSGNDKGVIFYINTPNTLRCWINDSPGIIAESTATQYTDGSWHHAACRLDRDAETLDLFVDGILRDSVDASSLSGIDLNQTDSGHIGNVGSVPMDGTLDDVRIYNYPLTAQQIQLIANDGGAVRFAPVTGSP